MESKAAGGVRAMTAMHYFHTFQTWRKTLPAQASFQGKFVFFFSDVTFILGAKSVPLFCFES